jgi:hypothetical protein
LAIDPLIVMTPRIEHRRWSARRWLNLMRRAVRLGGQALRTRRLAILQPGAGRTLLCRRRDLCRSLPNTRLVVTEAGIGTL